MKISSFTIILVAFVILLCVKMYHDSEMFQLRCVISGVDGNEYCVRDRTKVLRLTKKYQAGSVIKNKTEPSYNEASRGWI